MYEGSFYKIYPTISKSDISIILFNMTSGMHSKIVKHGEPRKYDPWSRPEAVNIENPKMAQVLILSDRGFKKV